MLIYPTSTHTRPNISSRVCAIIKGSLFCNWQLLFLRTRTFYGSPSVGKKSPPPELVYLPYVKRSLHQRVMNG